jgi:para-aminobenzoate synthetase component I
MRTLIQPVATAHTPESLGDQLRDQPGLVVLRSLLFEHPQARYSFVAVRPFLTFRSFGARSVILRSPQDALPRSRPMSLPLPSTRRAGRGEGLPRGVYPTLPSVSSAGATELSYGDPWRLLDALVTRYESLEEPDFPFPLGGCFGYWGYDLKNFVEPSLPRRAVNDLELPHCQIGFYASLVVFDHRLDQSCVIATGLAADGSRSESRARAQLDFWQAQLGRRAAVGSQAGSSCGNLRSNLSRDQFLERVERARAYIRAGDIYQVNLSQRLVAPYSDRGWDFFHRLNSVSPAPFSAYFDAGDFQLVSSSPEQFLRLSGSHIQTRPIKGTRPRATDHVGDARLAYELRTSPKEAAELVMITDLLRNDLGRVCEFGSVQVTDLLRLEAFPQVQHLVSTIQGRLEPRHTHLSALAACFPGGSITGAPKVRAMEIIDELEPHARGPYTGALGYLGFNCESQLSVLIRTAICCRGSLYFQVGAGIVADSQPEAEYAETLAKAAGFFQALGVGYSIQEAVAPAPKWMGP